MSNHLGDTNKMVDTETYMTIHSDGRITVSDKLKPDETAARVLECMKNQFLGDAQATKIRELQDRIKRLEDAGDAMFLRSTRVGREFWTKAKEAK